MTCNSPIYASYRPAIEASCVHRIRSAGAIVMGKTVTAEFAFQRPGPTRNPHDPTRTPGGSSSGSAAAVAARMTPVALATQTGGSTIRPAAYCGIFGYKPVFGACDTRGIKYLAPSFDTIGVMARELEDIARVSAVLRNRSPVLPKRALQPPEIALFLTPYSAEAEPPARACLEAVANAVSAAGAPVRTLDPEAWLIDLDPAHRVIMATEAARSLMYEWQEHQSDLSSEIAGLIRVGRSHTEEDIADARALLARARHWFASKLRPRELILTFSATGEAPTLTAKTGSAIFNRLWSGIEAACLTIPTGLGPNSMPLGVQLVDINDDEENILQGAQWIVAELGLGVIPPRTSALTGP
jgi:Asp-tRNA(Asn)/Glu-tRNA(Gln) amidotransferase A subunit family amidase